MLASISQKVTVNPGRDIISAYGWRCRHVIKVSPSGSIHNFGTIENDSIKNRLQVYSFDRRRSKPNVIYTDVNLSAADGNRINLIIIKLAYSNERTYLSDIDNKAVPMFSTDGEEHNQILWSNQLKDNSIIKYASGKNWPPIIYRADG